MINKIIASFSLALALSSTALPAAYPAYPLHEAARVGNVEQLRELLTQNPAAVNTKDDRGRTPLHCAALWNHRGCVEELLKAGADFEAKTINGKTAKEIALGKGYSKIVELLQWYENNKNFHIIPVAA